MSVTRFFVVANLAFLGLMAWILLPALGLTSRGGDALAADPPGTEVAIFAGGCFWCVEADFDKVPGVMSTVSGYTGGSVVNPSYKQVTTGSTGHTEAVRIVYDPKVVTYERLLHVFWRSIDPLTRNGQFCDFGTQYRSGIHATNDAQLRKALASRDALEKSGRLKRPVVTEVVRAGPFYPAEGYHQDYYKKNAFQYNLYRFNCGRDARLEEIWGPEAGGASH